MYITYLYTRAYERLEHCGCRVQSPRRDAADGALVNGFQDSNDKYEAVVKMASDAFYVFACYFYCDIAPSVAKA